jgi:choline dehydrogenase
MLICSYYVKISQWPRGKALGGSSVQNIMMFMRGNPRDYDRWAEMTEDEGWNYENVLPYFKKFEDFHGHANLSIYVLFCFVGNS